MKTILKKISANVSKIFVLRKFSFSFPTIIQKFLLDFLQVCSESITLKFGPAFSQIFSYSANNESVDYTQNSGDTTCNKFDT